MEPGYQFERERFYLTAPSPLISAFFRPVAIWHVVNTNEVTETQYLQLPVMSDHKEIGTVNDFMVRTTDVDVPSDVVTRERLRNVFIYDYMYDLDDSQSTITELNRAIDVAQESGIQVYAYLTPIDFTTGAQVVGPEFLDKTKANAAFICSVLLQRNVPCLNLAFSLKPKEFGYTNYPNEHLTYEGRASVAEQVDKHILVEMH